MKVRVYPFNEQTGVRTFSNERGQNTFYEQPIQILQSDHAPDCPGKVSFRERAQVLAAGVYEVDLIATPRDKYGRLDWDFTNWRPVAAAAIRNAG